MTDDTNTLITECLASWTVKYLKEEMTATDEELTYFARLTALRNQKRMLTWNDTDNPSVVIDDFLYHGDIYHASNMDLLKNLGIRHILNTCDQPLETDIIKNFNVLWINIEDNEDANINQHFQETNNFLLSCKEKKEKVLVHCLMGISRSTSIVLAYLMKYHHDTLMQAYGYLLDRRPISSPNSGFLIQLIRYEKALRNNGVIDEQKNNNDKQNPIKSLDMPSTSNVK